MVRFARDWRRVVRNGVALGVIACATAGVGFASPAAALASPAAAASQIPFGSYAAFEKKMVSGTIVDAVQSGRFIRGPNDDSGRVSWRVAGLKHAPPTRPAVYILGGSAARECIVGDAGLSAAIVATGSRRVSVRMLAMSNQSYPQALAIVNNLPRAQGGIVVIGVHHVPFAAARDDATEQLHGTPLLMKSRLLREFVAAQLGGDPANDLYWGLRYFSDTYRQARGVTPFRGARITYRLHRYSADVASSDAGKREFVDQWLTGKGAQGGEFDSRFAFNAASLAETVRLARAKGFEVLLMECPQDLYIVGSSFDRYKEAYRGLCQTLVDEHGAHWVDLNPVAAAANEEFADLYHLIGTGRDKWQAALADALAAIVADHLPPPAN